MKRLFFAFALLLTCNVFGAYWEGQYRDSGKKRAIDDCIAAVNYRFTFVRDTISKHRETHKRFDNQMLEIGKSVTHYYSLFAEDEDSVAYKVRINKSNSMQSFTSKQNIPEKGEPIYEDYFGNYPITGQNTVITRFAKNDYIYTEPQAAIEWKLANGQADVIGYKCQKATATFRGRHWTVWYAPELPFNYGPWKFGGLPGLILKAVDDEQLFSFEATGITQPKGYKIYKYDIVAIKSSRNNVAKMLELRWQDPIGIGLTNGMQKLFTMDDKTGKVTEQKPGDIRRPYIPTLELE